MKTKAKRIGRPRLFNEDAAYLTVKLHCEKMRRINRFAGGTPGGRAAAARKVIDAGLKAMGRA